MMKKKHHKYLEDLLARTESQLVLPGPRIFEHETRGLRNSFDGHFVPAEKKYYTIYTYIHIYIIYNIYIYIREANVAKVSPALRGRTRN